MTSRTPHPSLVPCDRVTADLAHSNVREGLASPLLVSRLLHAWQWFMHAVV